MNKLFIVQTANGNLTIVSEWNDNPNGAIQTFHNTCKNLWADKDTTQAYVEILDEQMNVYKGYREFINKVEPTPEAE